MFALKVGRIDEFYLTTLSSNVWRSDYTLVAIDTSSVYPLLTFLAESIKLWGSRDRRVRRSVSVRSLLAREVTALAVVVSVRLYWGSTQGLTDSSRIVDHLVKPFIQPLFAWACE